MRFLCVALAVLFAANIASASWLYDVFEEAKEGVQKGISEALKDKDTKETVEKILGNQKVQEITNKVKDVITKAKEEAPSMLKLGMDHIKHVKWDEVGLGEKLKKSMESFVDEPTVYEGEVIPTEEEDIMINGTSVSRGRHHGRHGKHGGRHGKHGGHHGKHGGHHGKHSGHHGKHGGGRHGKHGHHGRRPHHGLIKTMLGFHKRLTNAFEKENSTKNNPFKFGWEKLVKGIQKKMSSGGWKNTHEQVKTMLNEAKKHAETAKQFARVPLHRMSPERIDWGEARLEKLEKIFTKLASNWGDFVRGALDETPSPSTPTKMPVEPTESPEELALIKLEKATVKDDKPFIKMLSVSEPEYEYAMKKTGEAESKMTKLENEWEAKVEKEEEELTKGIMKEHTDEEPATEEETEKGFPISKGVMIPAPGEEESSDVDDDDDIDFEPLVPVKSIEIESPDKPAKENTFSYMGIPAKIFHIGESAENTESALKEEEQSFYKLLAKERKEWLALKQTLLQKLAKMGKHRKY